MSFELQSVQSVKSEGLSFMNVGALGGVLGKGPSLILFQIFHESPIRQR